MQSNRPSLANLPRYLYKFRSLAPGPVEFTKRIISHRELFFSCPLDLNDPFEGYFALDREDFVAMFPELMDRILATVPDGEAKRARIEKELPHLIETFRLKTREDYLRNVGIVSLSARYDSTLMWSHYSDSHRGVCFEFDLEHAGDWAVLPVVYADDCLVGRLSDPNELSSVIVASVYHKSSDWRYEQEWRFMRLNGPGPAEFPAEMLSGVILGSGSDSGVGQELFEMLKSYQSNVRIGIASRDPFSYRTHVVAVGDSRSGIVRDQGEARPWHMR